MNAKTIKMYMFLGVLVAMIFHCKSTADQPESDYNLLAFLGKEVLNSYYWQGKAEIEQCNSTNNILSCEIYRAFYNNVSNNLEKNLSIYADSLQKMGNINLIIANPDNGKELKLEVPVSVSIEIGPETGNGYGRILKLSNSNSFTIDGINILLLESKSDVLEDGIRGFIKLQFQASDNLVISFSYRLDKIL